MAAMPAPPSAHVQIYCIENAAVKCLWKVLVHAYFNQCANVYHGYNVIGLLHVKVYNTKMNCIINNDLFEFGVAQRKRGGPITLRSLDRNQAPKLCSY